MDSIGTLAGGIAHDFNNLLTGIQGRASLALTEADQDGKGRTHLLNIQEYVQSATCLTKQLLGFARSGKYHIKVTDLNKLISKIFIERNQLRRAVLSDDVLTLIPLRLD